MVLIITAKEIRELVNNLFWLPASDRMQINKDTVLVGQDGWADGRFGDYQNSTAAINDSRMISDLFQVKILGRTQLLEKMQQLADADVNCLKENLFKAASKNPKKIIVLTHVPPFKEVCQHEGRISDDNWLPYFSSKVMGDLLLEIAQNNSNIEFLVLCGHTHSAAIYQPNRQRRSKRNLLCQAACLTNVFLLACK